jgi:hypothetical protein
VIAYYMQRARTRSQCSYTNRRPHTLVV